MIVFFCGYKRIDIAYTLGFINETWGSLLNFKGPFMLKKSSIITRKNPFGTKVLYRLLFILHYSATFCSCD